MARMGGSRHLKRLPSPAFWPIHRKEYVWVAKPRPGPHPIDRCLPLLLVLRDILGYAKTRKEAKRILAKGYVRVDGRVRRDEKFPVGLMDVVEIVPTNECFRVLPVPRRGLVLHRIGEDEKGFKLCRVERKVTVRGGHIQLGLHDGRNVLIRVEDPSNPPNGNYKTMNVLKMAIPKQEVLDIIRFEKGVLGLVIGGINAGRWGRIVEIEVQEGPYPAMVTLEDANGDRFQTIKEYVFPIGTDSPWVSLPG